VHFREGTLVFWVIEYFDPSIGETIVTWGGVLFSETTTLATTIWMPSETCRRTSRARGRPLPPSGVANNCNSPTLMKSALPPGAPRRRM
jgi:hypothetical protein